MIKYAKSFLLLSLFGAAVGCSGGPANNQPVNNTSAPTPAVAGTPSVPQQTPSVNPPAPDTDGTPSGPSAGSLATPSDAYKAAYDAREKKDVEALKKVMSQEMLAYTTRVAQTQKKTLDQMLAVYFSQPQAPKAETRNERIAGNRAKLEFKDPSGQWMDMDFVKEDGGWKMALSRVARPQRPQATAQVPPPPPAPQR